MPRVKMTDTTHHRDYGAMPEGAVFEVSDEDAERLVRMRIATRTTAKATADVGAVEAENAQEAADETEARLPDETPAPLNTPAVGRGDVAGLTGEEPDRGARGRR